MPPSLSQHTHTLSALLYSPPSPLPPPFPTGARAAKPTPDLQKPPRDPLYQSVMSPPSTATLLVSGMLISAAIPTWGDYDAASACQNAWLLNSTAIPVDSPRRCALVGALSRCLAVAVMDMSIEDARPFHDNLDLIVLQNSKPCQV